MGIQTNATNQIPIIFLEKFMELFCDFKYTKPYFGNYTGTNEMQYYNIVFVNDYDKCNGTFTQSCEYFQLSWQNYQMISTVDIVDIKQIIPDTDIKKITGKLFECIEPTNKTIRPVEKNFWERKQTNLESILTHWDQIPHDKKTHYLPGIIDTIHPHQLHLVLNHFTDSINQNQLNGHNQIIKSVNQNQMYIHKYKLDKFHHYITPTHIKTIGLGNLNKQSVETVYKQKAHGKTRPLGKKIIRSNLHNVNSKSKLKYKKKLSIIFYKI